MHVSRDISILALFGPKAGQGETGALPGKAPFTLALARTTAGVGAGAEGLPDGLEAPLTTPVEPVGEVVLLPAAGGDGGTDLPFASPILPVAVAAPVLAGPGEAIRTAEEAPVARAGNSSPVRAPIAALAANRDPAGPAAGAGERPARPGRAGDPGVTPGSPTEPGPALARGTSISVLQQVVQRHLDAAVLPGDGGGAEEAEHGGELLQRGRSNAAEHLLRNALRDGQPRPVHAPEVPSTAASLPAEADGSLSHAGSETVQAAPDARDTRTSEIEAAVERLIEVRVMSRSARSAMALPHPDFGKVTLAFSLEGDRQLGVDLPDAPRELRIAVSQAVVAIAAGEPAGNRPDRQEGQAPNERAGGPDTNGGLARGEQDAGSDGGRKAGTRSGTWNSGWLTAGGIDEPEAQRAAPAGMRRGVLA